MKKALVLAAVSEAATGVALLVVPVARWAVVAWRGTDRSRLAGRSCDRLRSDRRGGTGDEPDVCGAAGAYGVCHLALPVLPDRRLARCRWIDAPTPSRLASAAAKRTSWKGTGKASGTQDHPNCATDVELIASATPPGRCAQHFTIRTLGRRHGGWLGEDRQALRKSAD